MFLRNRLNLLDETLVFSKPAVHRGEKSTEDDLRKQKEQQERENSRRSRTNRAQEEEDDCQRMLAQVQAVESGVERINGLGNRFK